MSEPEWASLGCTKGETLAELGARWRDLMQRSAEMLRQVYIADDGTMVLRCSDRERAALIAELRREVG